MHSPGHAAMTRSKDSSSHPAELVCPRCRRAYKSRAFCPKDGARLVDRLDPESGGLTPISPAWRVVAGRYELADLIGQGSMARVFRANDLDNGRTVAVKILDRRFADSERECRRFFGEAQVLLAIDHPGVVRVLDVGKLLDGRPFLVIEYLEGESLGDCVRRKGSLPIDEALRIVHQAALGLCAVHDAGIVHRDVKPDNIFLQGGPEPGVRLFDFGLAKLHKSDKQSQSGSGTMVGTAAYMAPEQVLAEPVDARSDVYSLGVVLFRAVTGHLPFDAPADLDLVAQQVLLGAPPASWFCEGLDGRVDQLIARAIRKAPENRPDNMRAFAEELGRIRQDPNASASDDVAPIVIPDAYVPITNIGKQAMAMLRRRLGVAEKDDQL